MAVVCDHFRVAVAGFGALRRRAVEHFVQQPAAHRFQQTVPERVRIPGRRRPNAAVRRAQPHRLQFAGDATAAAAGSVQPAVVPVGLPPPAT